MRLSLATRALHLSLPLLLTLSLSAVAPASASPNAAASKSTLHADLSHTVDQPARTALLRQHTARQLITFFPASSSTGHEAYETHLPGYDLQVRPAGMTIHSEYVLPAKHPSKPAFDGGLIAPQQSTQVVHHETTVDFVGANPSAQLEGLERGRARVNRFVGHDPALWQQDLPTFSRVRSRQLYPGIDLVYYGGGQSALEYDLVVAPHADPNQIRFRARGDSKPVLEADGSLDLDGKDGGVRLNRPVLYQDNNGARTAILGSFVQLAPGEFGFRAAAYDHNRPLIIDPTIKLVYATYIGGIHNEIEYDMALDASGNAYIVGESASQDFPVTGNALQTTRTAIGTYTYDAVLLKFDASGDLIFSTFLGGSGNDAAYALAVAPDGSVYIGGGTNSPDFPITSGAYQKTIGGGSDAFLAKISNDGSQLLYSTYLGGNADESLQSMILNTDGSLWLGGDASGPGLPVSANAAQKTAPGADDDFVAKAQFDANGILSFPYLSFLGGSGNGQELGYVALTTDSTGNLYLAGGTTSSDYPVTSNAYEQPFKTSGGCYNTQLPNTIGTLTKFSPDLSQIIYSTVIGGHTEDQNGYPVCNQFVRVVHIDAQGNLWLIGTTGMSDFPTSSNAMRKQLNGNGLAGVDDFIVELSADGTKLLYGTYFGGSQFDYGANADWDSAGHLWLTGTTASADYPVTSDALQPANAGGYDTGITEFSADATSILYSTYLGGSGDDDINGTGQIRLDPQGNVRLTGITNSTNYPVTATALQQVYANGDANPDGYDLFYSVLGTGLIGTVGPAVGGNTGDTTITVTGAGFQAGATCQITLNGTSITAGEVSVSPDGTKITCTFNLSGVATGNYDVTITNPNGGASFTKPASFTVQSGGTPSMWVNIVARPKIRTGVPSTVTVSYGNSGSVDAYMSHLVVNTPAHIQSSFVTGTPPNITSGKQVTTTYSSGGINSIRLLLPRIPAGSTGSLQLTITDSTDNDTYNLTASIAKPWFTSAVSAESALSAAANAYTPTASCGSTTAPTNCLGLYLTSLQQAGATAAQVQSAAGTMLLTLQQVEKYGGLHAFDASTLTFVPPSQMVAGTLVVSGIVSNDDTLEYHIAGVPQQNTIPISTSTNCVSYAGNPNDSIGGALLRCTIPISAPTGSGITIAGGSYGSGGNLIPTFDTCFTVKQDITAAGFTVTTTAGTQFCSLNADTGDDDDDTPEPLINGFNIIDPTGGDLAPDGGSGASSGGTSGGSIDPNGKSGPLGDGSAMHYTRASGALTYNVYFENEAKATLPAGQVIVTDQLDPTKVDLPTVAFGPVYFGTNTITPPSGSNGFQTTYTPPGVTSYIVRIQGSLDQSTGLLKWTFTTLDPTTKLPPSDPTIGFLPPDVDGIVGQGGVTYSVMPLAAAQVTGTQIPNGASVVFDGNAAIVTPVYLNTLDADPPVSIVTALPAIETVTGTATTATFPVKWSGTDKGAGIKTYTVYVSDNDGPFTAFQTATTATNANFTGSAGHTYGFYTIATDGAGNVEAAKTKPDTTTSVTTLTQTNTTLSLSATTAVAGSSVTISAAVSPASGTGTPTGEVTFMDSLSGSLGTETLSSGKASISTTTLAVGVHSITAVYAGDTAYSNSTSSAMSVIITAVPPDYTVSLSSSSATVKGSGGTATTTISLDPTSGFSGSIALSCSGLPARSTCTFNPASLTASGSTAAKSVLTITTNVSTSASLLRRDSSGAAFAFAGGGLLGLSLLLRRRRFASLLAILCLAFVGWGLTGCGGSSPAPSTPPGTYTVTITASSGATSHTAAFTLTVD